MGTHFPYGSMVVTVFFFRFYRRSWQDNLALTTDRVLMYRTGRVGVCLIAAMIYISLTSVKLFVPDWTEEDKAEIDANIAKDIYYNDEDEVSTSIMLVIRDNLPAFSVSMRGWHVNAVGCKR